jgi:hypothetical protein
LVRLSVRRCTGSESDGVGVGVGAGVTVADMEAVGGIVRDGVATSDAVTVRTRVAVGAGDTVRDTEYVAVGV